MSTSWGPNGRPPEVYPARRRQVDWVKVGALLWCIFAPWLVILGTLLYLDWLP